MVNMTSANALCSSHGLCLADSRTCRAIISRVSDQPSAKRLLFRLASEKEAAQKAPGKEVWKTTHDCNIIASDMFDIFR